MTDNYLLFKFLHALDELGDGVDAYEIASQMDSTAVEVTALAIEAYRKGFMHETAEKPNSEGLTAAKSKTKNN